MTTPNPITIVTCKRLMDHYPDGSPAYHACIAGEPGYWARGRSRSEAVGELIRTHPGRFPGIAVEHLEGRLAR